MCVCPTLKKSTALSWYIILIWKNLIYIYFLHTNLHMRFLKPVSSKTSSVVCHTKFILVKTRKMNDEFQKSPYILHEQHSGNAQKHLVNIFILLRQQSGNVRKHLVNIFVCVSNPLKEHSFILVHHLDLEKSNLHLLSTH